MHPEVSPRGEEEEDYRRQGKGESAAKMMSHGVSPRGGVSSRGGVLPEVPPRRECATKMMSKMNCAEANGKMKMPARCEGRCARRSVTEIRHAKIMETVMSKKMPQGYESDLHKAIFIDLGLYVFVNLAS